MKSLNSALGACFEKKSLWEPPVRLANWSTPPAGVQLEVKDRMTCVGGGMREEEEEEDGGHRRESGTVCCPLVGVLRAARC